MNDREFTERLFANPQDDSPEFLAALEGNSPREEQRAKLRDFDAVLRRELTSIAVPGDLRQKLLNPAGNSAARNSNEHAAANAHWFRRALPVAACLVVAIGLGVYSRGAQNAELEAEILAHVYWEAAFLDRTEALGMPALNAKLDEVLGASMEDDGDTADMLVTYADDCWVAKKIAVHMIMRGETGPVSVMMIPNTPVDSEFSIGDERFEGLVTPTAGGNLVVIGEKQEAIAEYRNLVAGNLHWDY